MAPTGAVLPAPVPDMALNIEHLSVTFQRGGRELRAVRDVSLQVPRGETRVLLGESGSGKSVTLGAILGTHGPRARITGSLRFNDLELLGLGESQLRAIRGSRIGFVPQTPQDVFDPLRRIGAQIVECLRVHGVLHNRSAARQRAIELLRRVGIPDPTAAARSFPHELSGGMCQRAAIALAISCEPALLLADEPTTALDVSVQAQILELFQQLQADLGMALVMVTHDVGVAEELGGDISVMYAGRIVEEGPTQQVLADPVHPYTIGLLRSRPSPELQRGELVPIPGQPPSLLQELAGCSFAARCDVVQPGCLTAIPPLESAGAARSAACPPRLEEVLGHGAA